MDKNFKLQIGKTEIISLTDGIASLPKHKMFPSVTSSEWSKFNETYPSASRGINTWDGRISCNLIRTPDRLILIDTGVGPRSTAFSQFLKVSGDLPLQLKKEGIAPTDVDTVFLTHLHADHVGWNTLPDSQKPFFPKAKYYAHKKDWEMGEHRLKNKPKRAAYMTENVLPLEQYLHLIDEKTFSLAPGITAFSTPGHTPGHMSVEIQTNAGQSIWMLGDAFAHPLELTEPTHEYIFDHDPYQATKTRIKLLKKIDQEGAIIGGCHFPFPGYGYLVRDHGMRIWTPLQEQTMNP